MTLEYEELMDDMKKEGRRKLQRSFKSNTRIYNDGSIEVEPQQQGEPSQKEVKKVGKSKRYVTNGKNPLTCVELKCPNDVADKAAYFEKELAKLTRDIAIREPQLSGKEFLMDEPDVKLCISKDKRELTAWLTFHAQNEIAVRQQLYTLTSKIDKCLAFNENLVSRQK